MRFNHLSCALLFSMSCPFTTRAEQWGDNDVKFPLAGQPANGDGGSPSTVNPTTELWSSAAPERQEQEQGTTATTTTTAVAKECEDDGTTHTKHEFNPFIHKEVYKIQVHATRGLQDAYDAVYKVFGDYLTATAGQRFEPPISFEVVPNYFDGLFQAIEEEEMDFLYANPGVFTCVGVEAGATALTTVVKDLEVRNFY